MLLCKNLVNASNAPLEALHETAGSQSFRTNTWGPVPRPLGCCTDPDYRLLQYAGLSQLPLIYIGYNKRREVSSLESNRFIYLHGFEGRAKFKAVNSNLSAFLPDQKIIILILVVRGLSKFMKD